MYLYMCSLYIVTDTFGTVGYGDFVPSGSYKQEYILFLIMMLTGVGVFTILIKRSQEFTLSRETDEVSQRKENVDTWIMSLNHYSKKFTHIKAKDMSGMQDFFESHFRKTPLIWISQNEFFEDLSSKLKTKLAYSALHPLYLKFKIFFSDHEYGYKANKNFVRDILSNLYIQNFQPDQTVISYKENVEELSFIFKG